MKTTIKLMAVLVMVFVVGQVNAAEEVGLLDPSRFSLETSFESWKTDLNVDSGSVSYGGGTKSYTSDTLAEINSSQKYLVKQRRGLVSFGYKIGKARFEGTLGRSNIESSVKSGNVDMCARDGGYTYGGKVSLEGIDLGGGFFGESSFSCLFDKRQNLSFGHPVDPSATKDFQTLNLVGKVGVRYAFGKVDVSGGLMYHDLQAKETMRAGGTERRWNLSNKDKSGFYAGLGYRPTENVMVGLGCGATGSGGFVKGSARIRF